MTKKQPKILLINPYIHDFSAYDLWMKPLGLTWLGGYLEQHGYRIAMVDCLDRYQTAWLNSQGIKKPKGKRNGCGPLPSEQIEKPKIYAEISRCYRRFGIPIDMFQGLLKQHQPEVILVGSMMTYWYPGVFETIALLKKTFPGVPIALGGVYATLCPEHAKAFSQADRVFCGPCELEVLKWLDSLCDISRSYPNTDLLSINEIPLPAHHLLSRHSSAAISTSLGCPLTCSYCASHKLQPRFRQRPVERVIEEIEYLVHKKAVRNIAFYDDALLIRANQHLIPILQRVIQKAWPIQFHTANGMHSRLITPELAKILLQAGVKTLRFSYERAPVFSPDQSPSMVDKDLEKAIQCFKSLSNIQLPVIEVYAKVGLPGQSMQEIVEAFVFIHHLGAKIKFTDYSPVPGTPDFNKTMTKYGMDPDEPLYQNNTTLPYFTGCSEEQFTRPLKGLIDILNYALDKGLNLADDKKLAHTFFKAVTQLQQNMLH